MPFARRSYFHYHQSMNVGPHPDAAVSQIAGAIGEPARARMLYSLVDGRARTATELAALAEVSPSTASSHLQRLMREKLVSVSAQGKHRYYSLQGPNVAATLEALSVLAGEPNRKFMPSTPNGLRLARSCYDHIAGTLGVLLHDRFTALRWLSQVSKDGGCDLTLDGAKAFKTLGIDIDATRMLRRRFAFACVDWSERRPHLGGALGAAMLKLALTKRWVVQELDSRALRITNLGRREMMNRLSLSI
jgi:DNA-binding transcriptional ArsR family regulator